MMSNKPTRKNRCYIGGPDRQMIELSGVAEGDARVESHPTPGGGIARGSVQECVPLLELAQRRRLLTPEEHALLMDSLEEIARMLSGLINGLDNREL
jgi:four helix bundle protein